MPYSSTDFDTDIEHILKYIKPEILYDLGSGAGKYGSMIKNINPNCRSVGVETEHEYIKRFNLKDIYSKIIPKSVTSLVTKKYFNTNFDTVIIGDVIEHILKSDGINLLNFLVYRTRWIIILFPEKYIQNSVGGHSSEAHISVWNENDFVNFVDRTRLFKKNSQRLIILKGYLETTLDVLDVERSIENNEKKD